VQIDDDADNRNAISLGTSFTNYRQAASRTFATTSLKSLLLMRYTKDFSDELVRETDTQVDMIGVKDITEIANVGMHAAIANAVYHPTGTRIRTLPIVPERLRRRGHKGLPI
jgi:hypothetical protein